MTIERPRLHHYGLTTGRLDEMLDWYAKVVGVEPTMLPQSTIPGTDLRAAFVSNDAAHHRIAMFGWPGLAADPDAGRHARIQHTAWQHASIGDLLDAYERVKGLGIEPQACIDHGPSIAFYYRDPDGNVVELLADTGGSPATASALGTFIDPERMAQARRDGASEGELHDRAYGGDLAPATPPDPRILL